MTIVPEQKSSHTLLDKFRQTRSRTLELVQTLQKDDFVVQTAPYMSPPKWHLGHVSWFYEVILSKTNKAYEFYSEEFSKYLNSYYHQFGQPHDKDKRGIISRPTLEQIFEYFQNINQRVISFLEGNSIDADTAQLVTLGMHHECQHQELLVYDLQHLLADQYRPIKKNSPPKPTWEESHSPNSLMTGRKIMDEEPKTIDIREGHYTMGYSGSDFCYDVELPEHKMFLNDYKIDVFPVTNGQYLKFIEDGGYEDFKHWLSDGWEAVQKNNWKAPLYWEKKDNISPNGDDVGGVDFSSQWIVNDFIGKRKINLNEPVCHVSFFEADAYCKWAGTRLPTEAEWEKAACWNEQKQSKTMFPWGNDAPTYKHANLLESYLWKCSEIGSYPAGKSAYGCYQMIGDVWEWTSSEFVGFPGFKSGFSEYNDKWFANQKVLRGGSFGTPQMSIRASYRNFFRLDERWMISGFRCCRNDASS